MLKGQKFQVGGVFENTRLVTACDTHVPYHVPRFGSLPAAAVVDSIVEFMGMQKVKERHPQAEHGVLTEEVEVEIPAFRLVTAAQPVAQDEGRTRRDRQRHQPANQQPMSIAF